MTTAMPNTISGTRRRTARTAGATVSTSSVNGLSALVTAPKSSRRKRGVRRTPRSGRAVAPRVPTLGGVTIAPLPSGLRVRTRPVDDPGGLLDLLPDERPLCWVRGGEGLVGWGEVARFTASGPGRFAAADAWWRSFAAGLDVRDEVGREGTGPVAFTSFTFADASPGSVVVVPRVVVGRAGGVAWITEFVAGDGPVGATRASGPAQRAAALRGRSAAGGGLPGGGRRERSRRMRAGALDKAALAHDLLAVAEAPLDPRFLLAGLARRYPSCWSFAVDGLVGATPELLVRRSGATVSSRVLAGTAWSEADRRPVDATDELARRLLSSEKDRREHALAVESLAAALRPLCAELDVPGDARGDRAAQRVAPRQRRARQAGPRRPRDAAAAGRDGAPDRGGGRHAPRRGAGADHRAGGHGPRPLRGPGRLDGRRRRRRAGHRAALRAARRTGGAAVRRAAGWWPTRTRTPRSARPRRSSSRSARPWRSCRSSPVVAFLRASRCATGARVATNRRAC